MATFTEIKAFEDPPQPKYRKDCPPDRALVVVQYGSVMVLEHIGPGVSYFDDYGELDNTLRNDVDAGLIGVYIWEGRIKTSYSEYTREHDAWLEGTWRLATEDEWVNHLNEEAVWDSSEWFESEEG